MLPKIAVAVPPKRALDITKCLRWEKNKQGELEVLPKRALFSCKIGIFSGGIRPSGLEMLPKGALTVLPMQSGAVKGSTQGASQDAVAVPSKGALKVLPKIAIGNFSGGRNMREALEVLPNANEF